MPKECFRICETDIEGIKRLQQDKESGTGAENV